jgi:uncharacterized protein with PIN domain
MSATTETLKPLVIEPDPVIEGDIAPDDAEAPPVFGRCPVCNKPLFPRDRMTGQLKAPPVGTGYESRAKCGGCGTILVYLGNGNWRPLSEADLTDDDKQADSFDRMFE